MIFAFNTNQQEFPHPLQVELYRWRDELQEEKTKRYNTNVCSKVLKMV